MNSEFLGIIQAPLLFLAVVLRAAALSVLISASRVCLACSKRQHCMATSLPCVVGSADGAALNPVAVQFSSGGTMCVGAKSGT